MPFLSVVIVPPQKGSTSESWWITRDGVDRFNHAGRCFNSLKDLLTCMSIRVTGMGKDETGFYLTTKIV